MSPERKPAVDDADAAFFGHGDRHLGARDRVHVGRDDRALQREVLATAAHERSIAAGSRRSRTLYCGVKRKSSNVQPRTVWRKSVTVQDTSRDVADFT